MNIYVRPSTSFWYLSQLFSIPLRLMMDSNRNMDSQSSLSIGQLLKVPGFVTTNYKIRQGDSIWLIAQRINLSVECLYLANPNLTPNTLRVGESIRIPRRVTWRVVNRQQEYDHMELMKDIRSLFYLYPFMRIEDIENSLSSRNTPELIIGHGSKRVQYHASLLHANEGMSAPILMTLLNDYLLSITNRKTVQGIPTFPYYFQARLSVVPIANPESANLNASSPSIPFDEVYEDALGDFLAELCI